jgi:fatty acid kinase fatty acid binding subunit
VTVGIVTDSACDLPQALADDLGIRIVPLTVRFGAEELIDRVDLTPAEFWARCAASPVLPETAAPAPGLFEAAYRDLAQAGADSIVVVSLSCLLSGSMQSAQLAVRNVAEDLPVEVVDSRSASTGQGMIAAAAARRARDGGGRDEVARLARDLAERTHVWGVLDDLDHLRRGGRIGGARALLASALAIKPIIEIRDGRVEEGGRQRTRTKAMRSLVDKVAAAVPLEALAVLHAETPDVDDFVAQLAPLAPGPLMVTDVGAVIGAHCGPGAIGVAYQTKGA